MTYNLIDFEVCRALKPSLVGRKGSLLSPSLPIHLTHPKGNLLSCCALSPCINMMQRIACAYCDGVSMFMVFLSPRRTPVLFGLGMTAFIVTFRW